MFRTHSLALSVVLALTAPALAGPDTTFTYQGSLSDAGAPADGSFDLTFSLWSALSGGTQLGSTVAVNGQSVSQGVFATELDFGAVFDGNPRWLQITVNGDPLTPRQPVTRSPYSIATRGITVDADKNVGIGVAVPQYPLHVVAPAGANFTLFSRNSNVGGVGIYGQSDSVGGNAIIGYASASTGASNGLFGLSPSTSGRGVFGQASASTGETFGVRGLAHSTSGRGIFGHADALTGETFGVSGQSDSPDGRGVWGTTTAATGQGYGVLGTAQSPLGYGVVGHALSLTGPVSGVYGISDSTAGRGVIGSNTATTGLNYGVYGTADSEQGRGVLGTSTATTGSTVGINGQVYSGNGIGVLGNAFKTSGSGIAVMGINNSPSGFDFYAAGAGLHYGQASSIRWKHNVVNIDRPLDKLAQMRGVYFDWDEAHGGHHDMGFIAEEIGKVLPEVVAYEADGQYAIGMDYGKVTPLLVESVNALRERSEAQIDSLQRENRELRERLDALEETVRAMQAERSGD